MAFASTTTMLIVYSLRLWLQQRSFADSRRSIVRCWLLHYRSLQLKWGQSYKRNFFLAWQYTLNNNTRKFWQRRAINKSLLPDSLLVALILLFRQSKLLPPFPSSSRSPFPSTILHLTQKSPSRRVYDSWLRELSNLNDCRGLTLAANSWHTRA